MSDLRLLFESGDYSLNSLSVATAVAALLVLLLGITVLLRRRHTAATRLFYVVTMVPAAWLGAFAMMYAAQDAAHALVWARVGFFFSALLPGAVYHFAAVLASPDRKYRRFAPWVWAFCAIVGATGLLSDLIVQSVRRFDWGFYPTGRPHHTILAACFIAIFLVAMRLFWKVYRAAEGRASQRAGALLLAFVIGALGMLDFLPAAGIDMRPIRYVTAVAFAIVAAAAVWRFELNDITPEYAAGQILSTMKSAVLVSDMSGRIRVVNRAAGRLLGRDPEELRTAHVRDVIKSDDKMSTGQLLNSMGVMEHPMMWRAADGSTVDVLAASSLLRDDRDDPVGVVYVASDFTERKRAEEALRESERRYRLLFEMNPLPMWVYDFETLEFTAVNHAAVEHYGYSRDEFLRMKISDIRPETELPVMMAALAALADGQDVRGPSQYHHRRKDGSIIDVDITSFEFVAGGRRSRLVIAQDITERRRAEEQLRLSEERYRELFENANDMIYTHDLDGRLTSMNISGERVSGYSREELLGTHIQKVLAPEYLEKTRESITRKLRGEATSTFYEVEILSKNGIRIPIELSTRLIYENGVPIGVQGIARDVTERKASEARYRLLFERNLAGVYRTGADGRIVECNDACARILGCERREELLGLDTRTFYFDEQDRVAVLSQLESNKQLSNLELKLKRRDGTPVWVLENVTLLEEGMLEGTIIDITDRKHAIEQIEYQAYHDALTGLPNRALFRDRVTLALAHARRAGVTSAVMFLDLDHFKHVNDTLGHTVGDRLLQAIAARLVNCVRAEDTVARMGGDEFTILLAELTERRAAIAVAEKVLEAVRQPVVIDEHEIFVTTSIGIGIFPDHGDDAESLLRNADAAMYFAKEMGRNNYRYGVESGPTPEPLRRSLAVEPDAC